MTDASSTIGIISTNTLTLAILGSTVVATVVGFALGWVKESYQSWRRKELEREERLYSSLRLNLMLMNGNTKTKQEILVSRHNAEKKEGYVDRTGGARMKKFTEDYKNLTEDWWGLARKVLYDIRENPQYIKEEDWPIIEKLFESHIFRKFITGEATPKDGYWMYDDDITEKDTRNEFVETIKELHERVKK